MDYPPDHYAGRASRHIDQANKHDTPDNERAYQAACAQAAALLAVASALDNIAAALTKDD